jgi:release factor glutamine methyltransferase
MSETPVSPEPAAAETCAEALRGAAARLDAAGVPDPWRDARLLLASVLDVDVAALMGEPETELTPSQAQGFAAMVAQRAERRPVSRILGAREFWSLRLAVRDATLDPRPDSETVVDTVLGRVPAPGSGCRILDLGTGTGCLLIALLSALPGASGVGVDRDSAIVDTARANAAAHGVDDRARFVVGDWARGLAERFDVIVCNPPYLRSDEIAAAEPEVSRWEPAGALDGGPDGLDAYRALLPGVHERLAPDGLIVLEVGAGQAEDVGALVADHGLTVRAREVDLTGTTRCVIAAHARTTGGQGTHDAVGETA